MKGIKEQREIINRATHLPWFGEYDADGSYMVAETAYTTGNRIFAKQEGGTFPYADKNFIISASENYPALLDWAERARRVLCDVDEFVGESSIGAAASQLLEELPE